MEKKLSTRATLDSIHPNPDIAQKLRWIYALRRKDIDFRLHDSPFTRVLERLGNPHLSLPPAIHVAGTNGKGSTIAFMRAILEADGKSVHSYTSPHLHVFNERINLNGAPITDSSVLHYINSVEKVMNDHEPLTFFEFTSAMTFLAFSETPADAVLLETGMGGRLDCSNVIADPRVAVITAIGYDHQAFLGDTLPEIAAEKAGIIKDSGKAILGPQTTEFYDSGADKIFDAITHVTPPALHDDGSATYAYKERFVTAPPPTLVGAHQYNNAATAITACIKGFDVSDAAIKTGITSAFWPARLETINNPELLAMLPAGSKIIYDGGPNTLAAQALVDFIATQDIPCHVLLCMQPHKDIENVKKILTKSVHTIHDIDFNAVFDRKTLQKQLKNHMINIKEPSMVIIFGSLYLRDLI